MKNKKSATNGWKKFLLLLWKIWIQQKRHPFQAAFQVLIPVLVSLILYGMRTGDAFGEWSPRTEYESFPIEKEIMKSDSKPVVYWTPNNTLVQELMEKVALKMNFDVANHSFANETAMIEDILENQSNKTKEEFLGGIVFENSFENNVMPKDIKFKIRMRGPMSAKSQTNYWVTEKQFEDFPSVPRQLRSSMGGPPSYYEDRFLILQDAISRAVIEKLSNSSTSQIDIEIRRFPYPKFFKATFMSTAKGIIPGLVVIGFIYLILTIIKDVVNEKEKRLKESMKMMGLSNWMQWSSWFVKYTIYMVVICFMMTMFLKAPWQGDKTVFQYSNGFLLFNFLFLFAITSICFSFLISVLFSSANSAATAGGVLWVVTFLLSLLKTKSWTQQLATCLVSNTATANGFRIMASFEMSTVGLQWANLNQTVSPGDSLTMFHVMVMLTVDAVFYMLLALYIEAVFPGEFGVPQPYLYFLTESFWTGKSVDSNAKSEELAPRKLKKTQFIEEEPEGMVAGIRIQGLTKEYQTGKVVVNNIRLNMFQDQITVLLGHNGAGKSTTMSILTGLYPPTSGTAFVNGYDIRKDMSNVRESLGLCPQHDVLFDDITVEEHLIFFCNLKGLAAELVKNETDRLLKALELEDKRGSMINTLSGGMKRKLCVAIALCAGSKVVMFDEPTSGMDPAARRTVWDLLLSEKKGRTMLLTTHFMEEADLLGDRIAIMATGQVQCCGSTLFLKSKYGVGYHLVIVKDKNCDVGAITKVIQDYIPGVEVNQDIGAELTYLLPAEKSEIFENLFDELEEFEKEFGIASYGASITTMEEVFLKVGELSNDHVEEDEYERSDEQISRLKQAADRSLRNSGYDLTAQQVVALLTKKYLYTVRHIPLFVCQMLIPILLVTFILVVNKLAPKDINPAPLNFNLAHLGSTTSTIEVNSSSTLENDFISGMASKYQSILSRSGGTNRWVEIGKDSNATNTTDYVIKRSESELAFVSAHVVTGVTFKSLREQEKSKTVVTAWFNNEPYHAAPLSLNLVHNTLLATSNASLTVVNHPLPNKISLNGTKESDDDGSLGFQVGFAVTFGMAFFTASLTLFIITERESKSRHLQFISGINALTFWTSHFLWDLFNYSIPCLFIMIAFFVTNLEGFVGAAAHGRFFLVFLLYGWAVLPMMYVLSFLFATPSNGFTRTTMINVLAGAIPVVIVGLIISMNPNPPQAIKTLDWLLMIIPGYNLGMSFSKLDKNHAVLKMCSSMIELCDTVPNQCCQSFKNCGVAPCLDFSPNYLGWSGTGIGRHLFFLALDGVIFFVLLALIEYDAFDFVKSIFNGTFFSRTKFDEESSFTGHEDEDVAKERMLICNTPIEALQKENNLIMKNVVKEYPNGFRAVNSVCMGVRRGECFGLLGVNGAGKTTCFKMLTGDEEISSGDAYLDGLSITENLKEAQQRLGYCPQFDGLIEDMTGRESLWMFCSLRGIPSRSIEHVVDDLTDRLLIRKHIDKKIKELSGGNKRKVSTAVALIGDPPIVFLDEPTTGMDPVARRQLWDVICRVRDNGQAIVLTSHSMEECEALCNRIAIMVRGQFKCLGSSQHLKNKFGKGYTLVAKMLPVNVSDADSNQDTGPLIEFIRDEFPGAVLKDSHQGLVHFHLPGEGLNWASIFGMMEIAKKKFGLEDYSVGQTTLEQIFLNFGKPPEE